MNVRLLVDTLRDVTLVPASAIQHNGPAAFVYMIEDNPRICAALNPV